MAGSNNRQWHQIQPQNAEPETIIRPVKEDDIFHNGGQKIWHQICPEEGQNNIKMSLNIDPARFQMLRALSHLHTRLSALSSIGTPTETLTPDEIRQVNAFNQQQQALRASMPQGFDPPSFADMRSQLIEQKRWEIRDSLLLMLDKNIIEVVLEMHRSGANPFSPDLSVCGFTSRFLNEHDEELEIKVERAIQGNEFTISLSHPLSNGSMLIGVRYQNGEYTIHGSSYDQITDHKEIVDIIRELSSILSGLPNNAFEPLRYFSQSGTGRARQQKSEEVIYDDLDGDGYVEI